MWKQRQISVLLLNVITNSLQNHLIYCILINLLMRKPRKTELKTFTDLYFIQWWRAVSVKWFTSHSVMKLFTSSGDALLCLLNSSFTYWSPRALKSKGRNRCRTRILLYSERTLETWAETAMTPSNDTANGGKLRWNKTPNSCPAVQQQWQT